MELGALRVELEVLDSDFQCQVDATRARRPDILDGGDLADGAGAKQISWSNQVVGMPLE